MNLSLEAALSLEGLIGHLAYVFLVASMLMRRMFWLQVFALTSFAFGIFYSLFILGDPVGSFWECLLAAISLGQLALMTAENHRARFSPEETTLAATCFPGVSRAVQRQILNLGSWSDLPPQSVLAVENRPLDDLSYVASGFVRVTYAGAEVAKRGPGALIGELTVATAAPASSTVTTLGPARVWQVRAETVRQALATRPAQATAFQAAFFRAASAKLMENVGIRSGAAQA